MTDIKTEDDYTKQEKTIYLNPTAALAEIYEHVMQIAKKEIEMWQAIYNEAVTLKKEKKDTYGVNVSKH